MAARREVPDVVVADVRWYLDGRSGRDAYEAGHVQPLIGQRFPLERAGDAQRALESRATIGSTLLTL